MKPSTWDDVVRGILERARSEAAPVFSHAYASTGRLGDPASIREVFVGEAGETIFDLASTTKALVTTPLFFRQKRLGKLRFEQTVGDWLGDKAADLDPALRQLTIRSLLRHESGLPAWYNFWICHLAIDPTHEQTSERFAQRLVEGLNRAASKLDYEAQKRGRQVYSDVGFLLLGLALERATERTLDTLFAEFCRDEIGGDTQSWPLAYGPALRQENADSITSFVPTAVCAVRRRELRGEVHDENCASFGGITAHSGLFGTGPALTRYLQAWASSETAMQMLKENAAAVAGDATNPNDSLLGLRQGSDPVAGAFGGGKSMGHYGFVGTAFWIEPNSGPIGTWRFVTLLTNRVRYGRIPLKGRGIAAVRKEVFETTQQLT